MLQNLDEDYNSSGSVFDDSDADPDFEKYHIQLLYKLRKLYIQF